MPLRPDVPATTPVGIRDFTPAQAAEVQALEAELTSTFAGRGYQRVVTPTFELTQVFERGLGPDGAARVLRFVDPQNGEVLCLRSDVTPQIGRMMAGPMVESALPVRLCYFERVFRLRQHSEFRRREVMQAGVELIGEAGPDADVEVLLLCDEALRAAGEREHRLSIGHVGIIAAAFDGLNVTTDQAGHLKALLRRKDGASLEKLGAELGIDGKRLALLSALCRAYGQPEEVLAEARSLATDTPALEESLDRLRQVVDALAAHDVADRCLLDLGEVLGFGYYTGLVFHVYVPGVGRSVASGGRYDELLGRYGRALPACGFAIDEESVTEARSRRA